MLQTSAVKSVTNDNGPDKEPNPWDERDIQSRNEVDGVTVRWKTFSFRIRRRAVWVKEYESAIARVRAMPKYKPLMKAMERKGYEPNHSERDLLLEMADIAMIQGCIISWNVTDRTGASMPFSTQNCLELFKTFPQLRDFLTEATGDDDTFAAEPSTEEKLGNSHHT